MAIKAGGIDSLESIHGLLKSLQIRAQAVVCMCNLQYLLHREKQEVRKVPCSLREREC